MPLVLPTRLLPRRIERGRRRHRRPAREHTLRPASFSSRKSVRASSRTHLHVPLQHGDERQEQRAVEPVLVELVGRDVRGRDHHDAEFEQPREQPAEDHRVGDVGDVEFVEAEQPAFLGDLVRGRAGSDRRRSISPSLILLPEHPHALVHVGHELVEMRAALAHHRRRLEEQVHQHGLAAADVAVDVQALGDRRRCRARRTASRPDWCAAPSDAPRRAARAR